MKAILRWVFKIIASALSVVLVFVMLPYAVKYAARIVPVESGAAIKASAVIASKLKESARLETLLVEEEGVMNYEVKPAFLPTVAQLTAKYRYEASFGIDLSKVSIQVVGNHLTFVLPSFELLQDNITPTEIYRDDYWYPWIKDAKYEELFESERLACRGKYLTGEKQEELWAATVSAFEKTIAPWIKQVNGQITISYTQQESTIE